MKILFSWLAKIMGRNTQYTPKEVIAQQLLEPRPLPMGKEEFHEWSERIISGALLPMDPAADPVSFKDSQRFALAELIMHIDPKESHKPDGYFINCLRKVASNQVAHAMMTEIRDAAKTRLAAKEASLSTSGPSLEIVK